MQPDAPSSPPETPAKRGRPRRAPAQSDVRNKLIRCGLAHLTERGYSAVGVDAILKAAGVPKGSFYHYFHNKADFGIQLITAYDTYFVSKLRKHFDDDSQPALDRFQAFLRDAESGMARYDFRRGCLIGNLGQEMGALPEEFRVKLIDVLVGWQKLTAECLRTAQDQGDMSTAKDPDALAAFFWIGWEGAVLRAKLERRAQPLHNFAIPFINSLTLGGKSKPCSTPS